MAKRKKKEEAEEVKVEEVKEVTPVVDELPIIHPNLITVDDTGYVVIPDTYPIKSLAFIALACANGKFGDIIYKLAIERLKEHPEEMEEFQEIMLKYGDVKTEEKSKSRPVLNAISSWSFGGHS